MKSSLHISVLVIVFILFITVVDLVFGQAERPDAESCTKSAGLTSQLSTTTTDRADELGCLSCHEGIESILEEGSMMLVMIESMGGTYGDPSGCVICHGGNPSATNAYDAHSGVPDGMPETGPREFYPDPGSIWIADNTCGQPGCHTGYVYRLERSLMNTEAGKIQGNLHTWGVEEVQNYQVPWGNYDIDDPDGPEPSVGSEPYKEYMVNMVSSFPDQFPDSLSQLPQPTMEEIIDAPHLAGFTYQRQECQRCHVGVRGREKRGDYRGMGCSACHILYSNEGYYEGGDPTIDREEQGHMLSHRIRGTRETGGIPVESCNSCHNRGKRIGVSFQGLMEFPYGTPYDEEGNTQPKLHTKNYLFVSDDLHHQMESRPENPEGGMLCQDCHTTNDVHGDGNISGTTLASVEIECSDCHGTPDRYPWELPLGFGEEFGSELNQSASRGVSDSQQLESLMFGTRYDQRDGFLISARGNPLGNVVRDGDTAILHSATGNDFQIPLLKGLAENGTWKSPEAEVAMSAVASHLDKLECYSCHASWVPQCYGCHVQVNFGVDDDGNPLSNTDWVASGSEHDVHGQTAESGLGTGGISSLGRVSEGRSYLRWEEPVLGINGEGRVTPLMPGCQIVYSVYGPNGEVLALNEIASSVDEAEATGQEHVPLAIDMAPVQPHTAQRQARTCESCHISMKAIGLGIGGGVFQNSYSNEIVEDLIDARTGEIIPERYQVQIQAIENLTFDWSTIIDSYGNQVQTVGTHWPLSRALNEEERMVIFRAGMCMACHITMTDAELWSRISTPGSINVDEHYAHLNEVIRSYGD